jgi:hypothetical protein
MRLSDAKAGTGIYHDDEARFIAVLGRRRALDYLHRLDRVHRNLV